MASYVEHANISVTDIDGAVRFLMTAMPDFRIRHDSGPGPDRFVHVGTDETYIAVGAAEEPAPEGWYGSRPRVNHLGFAVDDAKALRERMLAAGYREGFVADPHPHRTRVYFLDADGMEYEFVQYHSEDPAKRNEYSD